MEQSINVNKYIIKFSIMYVICAIIVIAIANFFEINGGSGASFCILIGATMYSVSEFIKDNKRVPTKEEKTKLVWLSLLITWLISIVTIIFLAIFIAGIDAFLFLFQVMQEIDIILFLCMAFIVSLIYFAFLSWCYGGLAKKQLETLQKKGKI